MSRNALLLGLLLLPPGIAFGATVDGDAWILGSLGVGTTAPGARFETRASSMSIAAFRLSAVDQTPLLYIDRTGRVALSTYPAANLDISGVADIGDIGMNLRAGNAYPGTSAVQIAFGYSGSALYRHAIRTRHSDSLGNNSIDFLLWSPAVAASALPTTQVLSLVSSGTTTKGSMHINPVDTALVELAVSSGGVYGVGGVVCKEFRQPSSRGIKEGIFYLGTEDEAQAYSEVKGLKHIRFRYKNRKGPFGLYKRGLLYEEAPPSIRGIGKTLSMNQRLVNAEMAAKELIRQLEAAQNQAAEAAKGNGAH